MDDTHVPRDAPLKTRPPTGALAACREVVYGQARPRRKSSCQRLPLLPVTINYRPHDPVRRGLRRASHGRQHAKGPRFPSGAVPQRRSREDCLSTEGHLGPRTTSSRRAPSSPQAAIPYWSARKGPRSPSGAVPQRRSREDCLSTEGYRGLGRQAPAGCPQAPGGNPIEGSMQGSRVSFGRSSAAAKPRGLSEHRRIPGASDGKLPPGALKPPAGIP